MPLRKSPGSYLPPLNEDIGLAEWTVGGQQGGGGGTKGTT